MRLKHRVRVERARLIQRIQEAIADDTNLAENSEYQAAKVEQEINEARITELEDKLSRAETSSLFLRIVGAPFSVVTFLDVTIPVLTPVTRRGFLYCQFDGGRWNF